MEGRRRTRFMLSSRREYSSRTDCSRGVRRGGLVDGREGVRAGFEIAVDIVVGVWYGLWVTEESGVGWKRGELEWSAKGQLGPIEGEVDSHADG
jgi:hypothetical protein